MISEHYTGFTCCDWELWNNTLLTLGEQPHTWERHLLW